MLLTGGDMARIYVQVFEYIFAAAWLLGGLFEAKGFLYRLSNTEDILGLEAWYWFYEPKVYFIADPLTTLLELCT